jgi:predicted alpha/beta-hydrolase family hydrolase
MGGRIATQIAAADRALPAAGLVLLGYPLHPPNRSEKRRDAHLPAIERPMLFVQGSRDPFGTPPELSSAIAGLSPRPTLHIVQDGDHSFKLSGRDRGAAQVAVYTEVQDTIGAWIRQVMPGRAAVR